MGRSVYGEPDPRLPPPIVTGTVRWPRRRPMPIPPAATRAFERLGGLPVIERLVDCFYARGQPAGRRPSACTARPGPVKAVLVRYLTRWTGGPQAYSAERGHPACRKLPALQHRARRAGRLDAVHERRPRQIVADPELRINSPVRSQDRRFHPQ